MAIEPDEGFEDALALVWRHSRPIVSDGQNEIVTRALDRDLDAGGGVAGRVVQQVCHDARRVAGCDARGRVVEVSDDANQRPCVRLEVIDLASDHRGEVCSL